MCVGFCDTINRRCGLVTYLLTLPKSHPNTTTTTTTTGRFVKREEEIDILVGTAMAASSAQQGSLLDQLCGLDDLMLQLAE